MVILFVVFMEGVRFAALVTEVLSPLNKYGTGSVSTIFFPHHIAYICPSPDVERQFKAKEELSFFSAEPTNQVARCQRCSGLLSIRDWSESTHSIRDPKYGNFDTGVGFKDVSNSEFQ